MPTFQTLSTIVSEFAEYLKKGVPQAILYPLVVLIFAMGAIVGYVLGWKNVQMWWESASTSWASLILVAVAVLGVLFLSYVLSGMDGAVSRMFQGDAWPFINGLRLPILGDVRADQVRIHTDSWSRRRTNQIGMSGLHLILFTAHDLLSKWGEAPADAVSPDQAEKSEEAKSGGEQNSQSAAYWTAGTIDLPVALLLSNTPANLSPGEVVTLYSAGDIWPLNRGGSLVRAIQRASRALPGGGAEVIAILTLAIPAHLVRIISAAGRDLLATRRPAAAVAIWGGQSQVLRWLPLHETPSCALHPGDLIDITSVAAGERSLKLQRVGCVEEIDKGWLVAVRVEEVALIPVGNLVQQLQLVPTYSQIGIPLLNTDTAADQELTDQLFVDEHAEHIPKGKIIKGQLVWEDGEPIGIDPPDGIVTAAEAIVGHHTSKPIRARQPIYFSDVRMNEVIIPSAPPQPTPPNQLKVHVVLGNLADGHNLAVAFNCRTTSQGHAIVPAQLNPKQYGIAPHIFEAADDSPMDPLLWSEAEIVTYTLRGDAALPPHKTLVVFLLLAGSRNEMPDTPYAGMALVAPDSPPATAPAQPAPTSAAQTVRLIVEAQLAKELPNDEDVTRIIIFNSLSEALGSVRAQCIPQKRASWIKQLQHLQDRASAQLASSAALPAQTLQPTTAYWDSSQMAIRPRAKIAPPSTVGATQPPPSVPSATVGAAQLPQSTPAKQLITVETKIENSAAQSGDPTIISDHAYVSAAQVTLVLLNALNDQSAAWRRAANCRNDIVETMEEALRIIEYLLGEVTREFRLYYPMAAFAVAPTSVGNVIRAVDSFCQDAYGLDATLLLPRLRTVMSEAAQAQIQMSEERLRLLEWTWLGAVTLGILGSSIGAIGGKILFALALWCIVFPFVRFVISPAILAAAVGYAEILRVTLERERGKVLALLGQQIPPLLTQTAEKELWTRVGQWWQDGTLVGQYKLGNDLDSSTSADKE